MIHLIIFSKDRACQLHCLLESIQKYTTDIFQISVVYTFSNADFEDGYRIIKRRFPDVSFIKEVDFYENVLSLVYSSTMWVSFATDDTVIYHPLPVSKEVLQQSLPRMDNECFSFRLGLNTIIQNPHNGTIQPLLNKYQRIDNCIYWNRTLHHPLTNYGYAFSMDMHVYTKHLMCELLSKFHFNNSNELESQLFQYSNRINYMVAFTQSIAVNVPMNNLSQVTETKNNYSCQDLNKLYLDGKVISLSSFRGNIIGCHQGFDLIFKDCNE